MITTPEDQDQDSQDWKWLFSQSGVQIALDKMPHESTHLYQYSLSRLESNGENIPLQEDED